MRLALVQIAATCLTLATAVPARAQETATPADKAPEAAATPETKAPEGPAAPQVDRPPAPEKAPSGRVVTLTEAQKLAAKQSYALKNIDETIIQADALIGTAWSMLLPNLSASASITRNKDEITMAFPKFETMTIDPATGAVAMEMSDMTLQEKWGKSLGFTAYMSLLNPRSFPLLKNVYDAADLARLNAQIQKNELLFAVTQAYYGAHTAEEIIAVHRENLTLAETFVKSSEARLQAGQGTTIDVSRAKLQALMARKALDDALDGFKQAKAGLAVLIGLEDEAFDIAGPDQVAEIALDKDALQKKATSQRLELRAADAQEKMAERSRLETIMKWLPTLDLTWVWSWNSASGFSGNNDTWMLIFGAKWELFDGGGRIAESKARASQHRMTQNARAETERQIRAQVEQLAIEVQKRQRNVKLADEQVAMAEETHHQVARSYEVGLTTSLELHDADAALASAKVMRVVERLGYDVAVLTLQKAVGEYSSLSHVAAR